MYRRKISFQHARRWLRIDRYTVGTLGVGSGLLLSGASCDCALPVAVQTELISLPNVKPTDLDTSKLQIQARSKSLWEQLLERAKGTKKSIQNSVRYIQRVMTYLIYGAPLVGLVPMNYLLGGSFPELEHATWSYLVWAIQSLGPCFIKLAQWASTRPDLFPPKLIERIEVLQDDVKVRTYPLLTENSLLSDRVQCMVYIG
jgi:hypothetical protein